MNSEKGTVAVIVGRYPALSETFVVREIVGLKALGWRVLTVSLWPAGSDLPTNVPGANRCVYGQGTLSVLWSVMAAILISPICTIRTLGLGMRDAIAPGEPLALKDRAKVLCHAAVGLSVGRWLRRRGVEHVHCHFAHAPTTIGMYAAHASRLTFSFVGHANDLFERRILLKRKLERAAFLSCISQWHRSWYRSICDDRSDRYRVIRCGVDTHTWTPHHYRPVSSSLRVATVCRLVPKKGIDLALRALSKTEEQWSFQIIGVGPEQARLRALSEELGCQSRVVFAGALSNDEVRARLATVDLFLLPCREDERGDRDGIPVSLMEAMSMGVPVITGDLPTIRELVDSSVTGFCADTSDELDLVTLIRTCARNRELRESIGRAGRERVKSEFSLSENLSRLDRALLQIIAFRAIEQHNITDDRPNWGQPRSSRATS